jgi:ABC-type ATPase with predicted acetyltransferase domain
MELRIETDYKNILTFTHNDADGILGGFIIKYLFDNNLEDSAWDMNVKTYCCSYGKSFNLAWFKQKTEEFIERFRYKATKSNQVQSRIKQLDKLDRIEVDIGDKSALSVKFHPAPRSGQVVFSTKNAVIGYGSKIILDGIDITIQRGEKIAFVGRNGEGKTTLMRIITKELYPLDGEGGLGYNVDMGYFVITTKVKTNQMFGTDMHYLKIRGLNERQTV